MTTAIVRFTIVGQFTAPDTPIQREWYHSTLGWPKSILWFCRHCGYVYARAEVILSNGHMQDWTSCAMLCEHCTDSQSLIAVPGSIWSPVLHPSLTAAMPRMLLLREFQLHEKWYEYKNS